MESLANKFEVSQETIRRDLTILAEAGLLRKVHGGAVRLQTAHEDTFALRSQVNRPAKEAIGRYASEFISHGDSLFINAGTTTNIFAKYLLDKTDLTVVTNCASVAETVWQEDGSTNQIFLLGGKYNGTDTETQGSLLLKQLRLFHTDHAFVTLGAVDANNGFMEYRVEAADIIRAMFQQARRTTVLADSTKVDHAILVKICDLGDVDRLITDLPPSSDLQIALDEADVELHITETPMRQGN